MTAQHIPSIQEIKALLRNKNIEVLGGRSHTKASEEYVDVKFHYPKENITWEGSVPTEYRRTGIHANTEIEIVDLLDKTYDLMNPSNYNGWEKEQQDFWSDSNKKVTKPFFDTLKDSKWKCVYCQLPKNPNWARRVQDLKEFGYTIATHTRMFCKNCNRNSTHLIMLKIPRGSITGYETWSPKLRKKIIDVLGNVDAYENRTINSLLPDHKFPEIRWDEKTRQENPDTMSDEEIMGKFQLLSNQRNQQKREVCRNCYQTGKRGTPFGIKFFSEGDENWPKGVLQKGKTAEKGCHGCGWYDLQKWREELNKTLAKKSHKRFLFL